MASALEWAAVLPLAQIWALASDAVLSSPMLLRWDLPWVSQWQLVSPLPLPLQLPSP
jgi:hypothetical protein